MWQGCLTIASLCPPRADLTNKPGYWAKALAERLAVEGELLAFWATSSGDVHFSLNGEEKGVFFSGVDTRGPLWALVDIYGNSTAVQLVGGWALRGGGRGCFFPCGLWVQVDDNGVISFFRFS